MVSNKQIMAAAARAEHRLRGRRAEAGPVFKGFAARPLPLSFQLLVAASWVDAARVGTGGTQAKQ